MSRKEYKEEGGSKEENVTTEAPHSDSGPSDTDIHDQASRVSSWALGDIRRFAAGSGEPGTRRRDEAEDRKIRKEYYPGWESEHFEKLLDIVESGQVEQQQKTELINESFQREVQDNQEARKAIAAAKFEVLMEETTEDQQDDMYQELLPLLDGEDFDAEVFVEQFELDKDVYGSWTQEDWLDLLNHWIES